MPFQSEKQRRYLHANHPEIAKRWERDYAGGGRIGYSKGSGKTYKDWLNYRIKEIAAQRIPVPFKEWKKGDIKFKAEGGFIPSHEAGIYGLAEGGRTGFYRGSDRHAGTTSSSSTHSPGHPSNQGSSTTQSTQSTSDTSTGGEWSGDFEDDPHMPGGSPWTAADHTPSYSGDNGGVNPEDDRPGEDNRPWGGEDLRTPKDRSYDFDFMYGHKVKDKKDWTEHNKRNALIETKQLGKEVFDAFKFGIGPFSLIRFGLQQNKKKKAEKAHLQKMIDDMKLAGDAKFNPHMDSPLQLAEQLMIDLNTPKKPVQDQGGDGIIGVASITYDDIEDTNKKELASSRWRQEQEKVDRSKQMAYWRMMMEPYMSAQGGRVPAGYNTGGLSNLFRLKNI